jgi:hypothetical protein
LPLLLAHRGVGVCEDPLQALKEVPVGEVGPQDIL